MNLYVNRMQSYWKTAVKVSALGGSLVVLTYGLVWIILNTLRILAEMVTPG